MSSSKIRAPTQRTFVIKKVERVVVHNHSLTPYTTRGIPTARLGRDSYAPTKKVSRRVRKRMIYRYRDYNNKNYRHPRVPRLYYKLRSYFTVMRAQGSRACCYFTIMRSLKPGMRRAEHRYPYRVKPTYGSSRCRSLK